jgi:3-hydroxymyristoyl/3-hydroxydecanoyl-(acyl carrier protein) dehydratase
MIPALPHEYPFRLADRVIARSGPGEGRVRATVTSGFWGRAYPGPLVGELIAQAALLLEGGDAELGRKGFLAGFSDLAIARAPEPGDVLDVDVRVVAHFAGVTRFAGEVVTSDGDAIAKGEVTVRRGVETPP